MKVRRTKSPVRPRTKTVRVQRKAPVSRRTPAARSVRALPPFQEGVLFPVNVGFIATRAVFGIALIMSLLAIAVAVTTVVLWRAEVAAVGADMRAIPAPAFDYE